MSRAETAVVIPCYDLGSTLGEAVASALAQTRPAAEVVVVDDGSTDPQTRSQLVHLPATVRVLRQPHRGLAAARNVGVRATVSPYLVTLDADDLLAPTYIERLAARLDEDATLAFVSCAIETFAGASYRWTPPPPSLADALAGVAPPPSSLFRRELFDAVGGFDEELPLGLLEDLELWIQALRLGFQGAVIDQPLVRYRVRRDSIHQRAAAGEDHRRSMLGLLERHRDAIVELDLEVVAAKERAVEGLRQHRRHLEHELRARESELEELRRAVAAERAALQAAGREPLELGELRRLAPLSPLWGLERGRPLDRYYIEAFLAAHGADVRGRVLEVKDAGYTRMFGGERVRSSAVLDVDPANPEATLVADLCRADTIASDSVDCFILTQTLHLIFDLRAALATCRRILAPGGVLLCTLPVVSRTNCEGEDHWRLTPAAAWKLFAEQFPAELVQVTAYGNLLACTAFLYGLSPEELSPAELAHHDPAFPLLLAVRAVKPAATRAAPSRGGGPAAAGLIIAYHRIAEADEGDPSAVTPAELRSQLAALRERGRLVRLSELAAQVASQAIPERAVAVTLDDATLDTLTTAAPILVAMEVPATVFATTERLDEQRVPWWSVLAEIFDRGASLPPWFAGETLAGRRFATTTGEQRAELRRALREQLLAATRERRDRILTELIAWSGLAPQRTAHHRLLTGGELRRLAAHRGIEIGSHTVHHLWLPRQGAAEIGHELVASRQALERLLGQPVRALAYPYGAVDAATVAAARQAGLTAAVTTRPAPVVAGMDPLLLPRCEITGDDGASFRRALRLLEASR